MIREGEKESLCVFFKFTFRTKATFVSSLSSSVRSIYLVLPGAHLANIGIFSVLIRINISLLMGQTDEKNKF